MSNLLFHTATPRHSLAVCLTDDDTVVSVGMVGAHLALKGGRIFPPGYWEFCGEQAEQLVDACKQWDALLCVMALVFEWQFSGVLTEATDTRKRRLCPECGVEMFLHPDTQAPLCASPFCDRDPDVSEKTFKAMGLAYEEAPAPEPTTPRSEPVYRAGATPWTPRPCAAVDRLDTGKYTGQPSPGRRVRL